MTSSRTVYRTCNLCEATCGLAIGLEGDHIATIRGDQEDVFSRGYICPKAYGLKGLHEDPDRLRRPVRRTATGWEEISWEEAYAEVGRRLVEIQEAHGPNAIGVYRGNPTVHDLHSTVYFPVLQRALPTQNYFSAATLDTQSKYVQVGLMFGGMLHIPIPDIDRTEYLLMLGANPLASNGSLMTAPDLPGRIKAVRDRGGRVVVIDPRRTETADIADEHHFLRPGTDAAFLLAMVHTMFAEGLVAPGTCADVMDGLADVQRVVKDFAPEAVATYCGLDADTIRRLTREFCAAGAAACYGRMGTCVQEFGTLASWGVDLVNVLSGNLDRPGGMMFTTPAASVEFALSPPEFGTYRSRVKGFEEVYGQLPAATMADEIETPGEGQIRAMITIAGNPVCSSVNAERLSRALASLDFMVAIDIYINETTRHADIILPPTSPLEHEHYDIAFYNLSVRDMARCSPTVLEPAPGAQDASDILLNVSKHLMGMGEMDTAMVDTFVQRQFAEMAIPEDTPWEGLTVDEAMDKLCAGSGAVRVLDLLLRVGPYGDGFGRNLDGLSVEKLRGYPHGLDLGPLKEQLPAKIKTPNGRIQLAPQRIVDDVPRLQAAVAKSGNGLLLIGRRHLRDNNSWMHNIEPLVKGRDRCTLHVSEADALRLQLETGGRARITSRVGSVVAPVEVTDRMMPGVVSLPHGWGHDVDGVRMRVAQAHAGVNANILTDDEALDAPSGTSVLNGIPVSVEALH